MSVCRNGWVRCITYLIVKNSPCHWEYEINFFDRVIMLLWFGLRSSLEYWHRPHPISLLLISTNLLLYILHLYTCAIIFQFIHILYYLHFPVHLSLCIDFSFLIFTQIYFHLYSDTGSKNNHFIEIQSNNNKLITD